MSRLFNFQVRILVCILDTAFELRETIGKVQVFVLLVDTF